MNVNSGNTSFVGVDVGGTSTKLGWIRDDGHQLAEATVPTSAESPARETVERIAAEVRPWLDSPDYVVEAIGLGTPGPMDLGAGMVLSPVNLPGWGDFPIRDELARATHRPVTYANDANAAAYGEYWLGAGRDADSLVLLTLGTGVGGGIVIDDQLITGASGNAAECGHCTIDFSPDARLCACGQRGHLECYCSATAVGEIATLRLQQGGLEIGGRLADQFRRAGTVTALDVWHAAEAGDPLARAVVDDTADWLVRGIANLAFTLDPELVLLGGAMDFGGREAVTGSRFLNRVREGVRRAVFPRIAAGLTVDFARLGSSAGWLGAAGLARRDFHFGRLVPLSH